MAFFLSLARRLGHPHTNSSHHMYASVRCDGNRPKDMLGGMSMIKRLARQNGTLKRVYQIQRREFPSDRRRYNMMDRAYYRRWHYLKYCTQVIKYSIKHGLRFRSPYEDEGRNVQRVHAEGVPVPSFGSGRILSHEMGNMRALDDKLATSRNGIERSQDPGYTADELRAMASKW
mmetsp:Transcript_29908/g.82110  ORF Transcript_29908/g.82110 Transcript_29908/m.82110 type:complete len:174 (+) Transcript_29908:70-591(+)